ncbi:fucose permease [Flavimobilis soli]|uniref:Fucose permease n=1 Tax=Flavimobilis soli TaxID=442709 RepID=A0A2A9EBH9_9MICO|nr:MFS transporter [Flavimobilis soli]PFG36407.1 fucose permease [Flavimobilis soli]
MTSSELSAGAPDAARRATVAAWAVFAIFVLNGFNFASWASRLVGVRNSLGLKETEMGMLLLFVAFGSIIALPLSGWIMERLGARRTIVVFAAVNVVGYGIAAWAIAQGDVAVLRVALVLVGIGTAVWDAAMNLEGAIVEQAVGRTIMPRLHAGFSLGTIVGSALGALMARLGVSVSWHLPFAVVLSLVLVLVAVRALLPAAGSELDEHTPADEGETPVAEERTSVFAAWLEPRTILVGLIVLAAALTEGSANDWVGLAVADGFAKDEATGATALTVFLVAMTGMRLLGTNLLDGLGRVTVLRLLGGLAFAGLALFAFAPWLWLAIVGVVLWGFGAALGFPVGMSAAADDPRRAAARVSVVSTIGYTAFFMGPPLIGLLAEHLGYRHALATILVPVALGLLIAGAAKPLERQPRDTVDG